MDRILGVAPVLPPSGTEAQQQSNPSKQQSQESASFGMVDLGYALTSDRLKIKVLRDNQQVMEDSEKIQQINRAWGLEVRPRHDQKEFNSQVAAMNLKKASIKSRFGSKIETANDIVKRVVMPKQDGAQGQVIGVKMPASPFGGPSSQ